MLQASVASQRNHCQSAIHCQSVAPVAWTSPGGMRACWCNLPHHARSCAACFATHFKRPTLCPDVVRVVPPCSNLQNQEVQIQTLAPELAWMDALETLNLAFNFKLENRECVRACVCVRVGGWGVGGRGGGNGFAAATPTPHALAQDQAKNNPNVHNHNTHYSSPPLITTHPPTHVCVAASLRRCVAAPAVVWGTIPEEWVAPGAFPNLRVLDLTNQDLGSESGVVFGDLWYAPTRQGGMPRLEQLGLFYCSIQPGEWGAGWWVIVTWTQGVGCGRQAGQLHPVQTHLRAGYIGLAGPACMCAGGQHGVRCRPSRFPEMQQGT